MIDIRDYGAIPDSVTDCSSAINSALLVGDIIIQNGTFIINESIKIPSNRTVYGKNALIKCGAASYDNVFRNSDFVNGNTNVNIIGLGNFAIDMNAVNNNDPYYTVYGNGEIYPEYKRQPESYRYVGIQIYKVTNFQIKNIYIVNFTHHNIHIEQSSQGVISDLYFNYKYSVSNMDGIDLLWGTHHITINNISGFTSDDFFAFCCGVVADLIPSYSTGYNIGDIHDITISNVRIKNSQKGRCPTVIVGNGNKLYNITMNNLVLIKSGALYYSNVGAGFEGTPPTADDIYNINIDNAIVGDIDYDQSCFEFGESMKDCAFTNIVNNSGKPIYRLINGDQSNNVKINGTQLT
jgi:polygalacturonase